MQEDGNTGNSHARHVKNFIDCVRTRNTPACPPEKGRIVAHYAHMANIAARTAEHKLEWDHARGCFTNSDRANEYILPEYRDPWKLPDA
jgi:hypothetical protein